MIDLSSIEITEQKVETTPDVRVDISAELYREYAILIHDTRELRGATFHAIAHAQDRGVTALIIETPDGVKREDLLSYLRFMAWDSYTDQWADDGIILEDYAPTLTDGIHWYMDNLIKQSVTVTARSEATEMICRLIATVPNDFARAEYTDRAIKLHKLNKVTVQSRIKNIMDDLKAEKESQPDEAEMPKWVNTRSLYTDGFVMNFDKAHDRVGIFWENKEATSGKRVRRLTNYTLKPLYLVHDSSNSRRMVEVYNGLRHSVVELPSKAFISQDMFETEIVGKGAYYSEVGFGKGQFKQLANWLMDNMPVVFELKTLGWQPEGFFAFSNLCIEGSAMLKFDEYGIVKVGDKNFLSSGVSKLNQDFRQEDNVYENDLYLKYVKAPDDFGFEDWAQVFNTVYDEHAPFGIAFIFISAFKDLVTRVTKCPHMYLYGPKGSGKSAIAESIMWFFFSGKNSEGKLIQGYNLNPGQGTPFSFFSRMERFRNVAMLFNEYDPNTVESWKKGNIKAAYDGEGREVGSGDTGKKRKTQIQKTNCTLLIAGQYLDTTDDGSVLSRSIVCKFSLEKNKQRTDEQKKQWARLNDLESHGISSLAADLYQFRDAVSRQLKEEFWRVQSELNTELRRGGRNVEIRLLSNYSLCIAMINIMDPLVKFPFTPAEFRLKAVARIKEQASILKENNMLNSFWKTMENLFADNQLEHNMHFKISNTNKVNLKKDNEKFTHELPEIMEVVYIRFGLIYDRFAKRFRETHNKTAPDQDTLLTYLKDQPYYIGMCPSTWFKDMSTNAFVVRYDALDIKLVKDSGESEAKDEAKAYKKTDETAPKGDDDKVPF